MPSSSDSPTPSFVSSLTSKRTHISGSIRRRLTSLSKRKDKKTSEDKSNLNSYYVYEQTMFPVIFRDPDAINKLLDIILDSQTGKRTLSRLARTCSVFSGPALAVLWRELDSLLPMIGLFPTSMMKKSRKPAMGLSRAPEEEDWENVIKYGVYVRRITYDERRNNVPLNIFPSLYLNRPQKWIFPNLESLTWKADTPEALNHCLLFICPRVQALTLEIGTKFPALEAFLTEVANQTSLTAFSFSSPIPLPRSFVQLLLTQNKLQKICLTAPGNISPSVGRWLSSLTELRILELDLSGRSVMVLETFFDEVQPRTAISTPSSVGTTDSGVFSGDELDFSEAIKSALQVTASRSQTAFSQLRQLQLTGVSSSIAVFLKHIPSSLTHLDIVIEDPPEKADWLELSSLICERFAHSLEVLRVSTQTTISAKSTVRGPTADLSLLGLSRLPYLRRLELELIEAAHFTARDIAHLAAVCPNLGELKLCPLARFPVATGPPRLTLEDLSPLLTSHRLHTLAAVVNAKRGGEEILWSAEASSDNLIRLHLGHSWIKDSFQVSVLLSHMAPRLDNVKWFHERSRPGFIEANSAGWQRVSDTLPYLQTIRLSERALATKAVLENLPIEPLRETAEKSVGTFVLSIDRGVLVKPTVQHAAIQSNPHVSFQMVQATPEYHSMMVDATPSISHISTNTTLPVYIEAEIDATPTIDTLETIVSLPPPRRIGISTLGFPFSHLRSVIDMLSMLTWKICFEIPLSMLMIPYNMTHMILSSIPIPFKRTTAGSSLERALETDDGTKQSIPLDTLPVCH